MVRVAPWAIVRFPERVCCPLQVISVEIVLSEALTIIGLDKEISNRSMMADAIEAFRIDSPLHA
jgi:hypothetical protein